MFLLKVSCLSKEKQRGRILDNVELASLCLSSLNDIRPCQLRASNAGMEGLLPMHGYTIDIKNHFDSRNVSIQNTNFVPSLPCRLILLDLY
jgi:hypothetical protein